MGQCSGTLAPKCKSQRGSLKQFKSSDFAGLRQRAHLISLTNCRNCTQDLLNAMGSMYAAVFFIGVQNASSVQPVVAVERTVFYRERAAGMYSALPYAFAQVTIHQALRDFTCQVGM